MEDDGKWQASVGKIMHMAYYANYVLRARMHTLASSNLEEP